MASRTKVTRNSVRRSDDATAAGVTQIVAGPGISISPPGGTGVVTITATGVTGVSSVQLNSHAPQTGAVVLTGVVETISGDSFPALGPDAAGAFTIPLNAYVTSVTQNGTLLTKTVGAVSFTDVASAIAGAGIGVSSATGNVTISNTGVTSIVAGTNVTVSGATGAVTVNATAAGTGGTLNAANQVLFSNSTNTAYTTEVGSTTAGFSYITGTNRITFAGGASFRADATGTTDSAIFNARAGTLTATLTALSTIAYGPTAAGTTLGLNNASSTQSIGIQAGGAQIVYLIAARNASSSLILSSNEALVMQLTGHSNVVIGANAGNLTDQNPSSTLQVGANQTVVSASGALWDGMRVAGTVTYTGGTSITSSVVALATFVAPTITSGVGQTVATAATVYVAGPPVAGGSVGLTTTYSVLVGDGISRYTYALQALPTRTVATSGGTGADASNALVVKTGTVTLTGAVTQSELALFRVEQSTITSAAAPAITILASMIVDGPPLVGGTATSPVAYAAYFKGQGGSFNSRNRTVRVDEFLQVFPGTGSVGSIFHVIKGSGTGILEAYGTNGTDGGEVRVNSPNALSTGTVGSTGTRFSVGCTASTAWVTSADVFTKGNSYFASGTLTFTSPAASTQANLQSTVYFDQTTYTAASSTPIITSASTVTIAGPPIADGTLVITNGYSLNVLAGASLFTPTMTVASAAGSVWDGFVVGAGTLTLSGAVHVTTDVAQTRFKQPTISTSAVVDIAATVTIDNAPVGGTITQKLSFYVKAGASLVASLTVSGQFVQTPVLLTDAATIAVDASLGNIFNVAITANRTMGAPSNPVAGQMILFRIKQDATGSRTITWNAIYHFTTTNPSPTLSTTANITDEVAFRYNTFLNGGSAWVCEGVNLGAT